MNYSYQTIVVFVFLLSSVSAQAAGIPKLMSLVPPLDSPVHLSTPDNDVTLPIADVPFMEHVRRDPAPTDNATMVFPSNMEASDSIPAPITTPEVHQGDLTWVGTADGLYYKNDTASAFERHASYGVDGPLSNRIAGIAVDAKDTLWVATPAGLSRRNLEGAWSLIRGKQGLPWEELTAIAIDGNDRIWLGSTRGLIQYRPYAEGRQWFYRVGERYLPNDHVTAVGMRGAENTVTVQTSAGTTRIVEEPRTLHGKAEYFLKELLDHKMRLGMPSPVLYDDAYKKTNPVLGPQPSDGLWTSYHIASMSMAYALTGEERYKTAAKKSMEAMYLLQNVTGIKGLVARTVIAANDPYVAKAKTQNNWHKTNDGKYWWRDDVSSDQIDGHYFAFYMYYEHIAKNDPVEKARLIAQIRQVTDYIVDNNYQIIDLDGKRTMWGWFNPELLNDEHIHYLESGIYSLMMLSFLKTTHYITGDDVYQEHYLNLIEKHHYLDNLLLQKKLWPDELNHSDDQLSAICFYPFLQIEHNPTIRDAVHRSLRRHALIERDEHNSLMAMVYASVDPTDADVEGAIQTLREMPLDRRNWKQDNSHRADVTFDPRPSVRGRDIILELLPADERQFERWNMDPYRADNGGDGRLEGTGVHYMLAYWLGRYHGVIAAP